MSKILHWLRLVRCFMNPWDTWEREREIEIAMWTNGPNKTCFWQQHFLILKNIYGTVGLVTPLLLPVSWVTSGFRHWTCQVQIVTIHYKSDSHYSFFLQWKAINNKMFLANPISTEENFSPSLLEDVIILK